MVIYTEPFKRHLRELIDYWKPLLLLHHYHIELEFSEEENEKLQAEINVRIIYLRGTITIYPPMAKYWKDRDYKYIQRVMVHELSHILSAEYSNLVRAYSPETFHEVLDEANEQLVQMIANIMIANKKDLN